MAVSVTVTVSHSAALWRFSSASYPLLHGVRPLTFAVGCPLAVNVRGNSHVL